MAERLGADGFRSPATHRVNPWLAELPVAYDCTVPMSDPYEPQPGGCCSPWPFFIGPVVELPYTIPQDHTTFTLLRQSTIDLWLRQLDRIEDGARDSPSASRTPTRATSGTRTRRPSTSEFLDAVAERDDVWRALPREVAAWWRERDAARGEPALEEAGIASIDDSGAVLLQPAARPAELDPALQGLAVAATLIDLRWRHSVTQPPDPLICEEVEIGPGVELGHNVVIHDGTRIESRGDHPGRRRGRQVPAPGQAVDRQPRAAAARP